MSHSLLFLYRLAAVFILVIAIAGNANAKKHTKSVTEDTATESIASVQSNPASVFERYAENTWVSRTVAVSDVGLNKPLILGDAQTSRDIYLPVPANVPLVDAALHFNSSYVRADGGRTTLLISLDNSAIAASHVSLDKGDASQLLPLASDAVASGFMHFGISWVTILAANINESNCTEMHSAGNLLRIDPSSNLSFRFNAAEIRDLTTAWSALPQHPVILVGAASLDPASYETAWRVGLTMERAGKRIRIVALPAVGKEVDVSGLSIPQALRGIPAFSALAGGGKHVIKDTAEIGAWFASTQVGTQHIDALISDNKLRADISLALDALAQQIRAEAPEALASFNEWRMSRLDVLLKPVTSHEIALAVSSGGATMLIAGDAGTKFAGLFDTTLRNTAVSPSLVVKLADPANMQADAVSLKALGAQPVSLDVVGHSEWQHEFEIGAAQLQGRRPTELLVDVAAAPNTHGAVPVAAVFINDVLLASKQLQANGQRERIIAKIPPYALAARNLIRVTFTRQLASYNCSETPAAFPISVLASSQLVLGPKNSSSDFTGVGAYLAQGGEVLLPLSYLNNAQQSLARTIRLSAATFVSPLKSRMVLSDAEHAKPDAPFLALDLQFPDAKKRVELSNGHLSMADDTGHSILEMSGLSRVAVASVESVADQSGIVYRTILEDHQDYSNAFQLLKGSMALMGDQGILAQYDLRSNMDMELLSDGSDAWYSHHGWWLVPLGLALAFLCLLYAASVYRRRKPKA